MGFSEIYAVYIQAKTLLEFGEKFNEEARKRFDVRDAREFAREQNGLNLKRSKKKRHIPNFYL